VVVVSQYTAPTYSKTADAVKADNPKAEGVIKFLYKDVHLYVCAEKAWYSTGLMELVLVQNSK